MKLYEITFSGSAKRELRDLTPDVLERILPRIRNLANDPERPDVRSFKAIRSNSTKFMGEQAFAEKQR